MCAGMDVSTDNLRSSGKDGELDLESQPYTIFSDLVRESRLATLRHCTPDDINLKDVERIICDYWIDLDPNTIIRSQGKWQTFVNNFSLCDKFVVCLVAVIELFRVWLIVHFCLETGIGNLVNILTCAFLGESNFLLCSCCTFARRPTSNPMIPPTVTKLMSEWNGSAMFGAICTISRWKHTYPPHSACVCHRINSLLYRRSFLRKNLLLFAVGNSNLRKSSPIHCDKKFKMGGNIEKKQIEQMLKLPNEFTPHTSVTTVFSVQ